MDFRVGSSMSRFREAAAVSDQDAATVAWRRLGRGCRRLPEPANSYPAPPKTTAKTTATAKTLPWERCPPRPQGVSPVFRTALRSVCADQGAFHSRCAPLQALGDSPPLALATPAGVGLGQGVVVSNYTAPIQKQQQRRKIND